MAIECDAVVIALVERVLGPGEAGWGVQRAWKLGPAPVGGVAYLLLDFGHISLTLVPKRAEWTEVELTPELLLRVLDVASAGYPDRWHWVTDAARQGASQ